MITDLDAIIRGFDQLTQSEDTQNKHSNLMRLLGERISNANELNGKKVRSIVGTRTASELWSAAKSHLTDWRESPREVVANRLSETLGELFDAGNGDAKLTELENPSSEELSSARDDLISSLAEENVYVLRRGDLESYCQTKPGNDKVAAAIEFCNTTSSLEILRGLHGDNAEDVVQELEGIFSRIFA